MTQEIKRILYATDLSENSAYAFGYAVSLAKKYDAEITILHVIDETMESYISMLGAFPNQEPLEGNLKKKITHLTEEINTRLEIFINKKVADDPESADTVISIEVCKGYPANEILKQADALHCDLIVMGRASLARLFLEVWQKGFSAESGNLFLSSPCPKNRRAQRSITFHNVP